MQKDQGDMMSKEEIIYYVDNLIEANKKSYDKRLAPLLYEFFLRANEKFEWSRDEFFKKYQAFRNNVKKIKFEKMKGRVGYFKFAKRKKGIFIDKEKIKNVRENPSKHIIYEDIINPFFHECQHATDLLIDDGIIVNYGLYEIKGERTLNKRDTMLNEYANVWCSSIIASDSPAYYDNLGIDNANNVGYEALDLPGSIICATFNISEIELAKLKDKGRETFNLYLKDEFPYIDIEVILSIFKGGLNIIYKANEIGDKENVKFGLENIIDTAFLVIKDRIKANFVQNRNNEEKLERIYYNVYKIQKILEKVDLYYEIEDDKEIYNSERFSTVDELLNRIQLYKRFLDNKDLFTDVEQAKIYEIITNYNRDEIDSDIEKELIESKIGQKYSEDEFDIEEIARKYYVPSNEPLNDNTALIKQIKRDFIKPTIKEKFKKIIGIEQEQFPMLPSVTEVLKEIKQSNMRASIRYETPIIHDRSTELQDTLRDNEESTRNENEDIR